MKKEEAAKLKARLVEAGISDCVAAIQNPEIYYEVRKATIIATEEWARTESWVQTLISDIGPHVTEANVVRLIGFLDAVTMYGDSDESL